MGLDQVTWSLGTVALGPLRTEYGYPYWILFTYDNRTVNCYWDFFWYLNELTFCSRISHHIHHLMLIMKNTMTVMVMNKILGGRTRISYDNADSGYCFQSGCSSSPMLSYDEWNCQEGNTVTLKPSGCFGPSIQITKGVDSQEFNHTSQKTASGAALPNEENYQNFHILILHLCHW